MPPDAVQDLRKEVNHKFDDVWEDRALLEKRVRDIELWRAQAKGFGIALTFMAAVPASITGIVTAILLIS
jgi:hypothetical protein